MNSILALGLQCGYCFHSFIINNCQDSLMDTHKKKKKKNMTQWSQNIPTSSMWDVTLYAVHKEQGKKPSKPLNQNYSWHKKSGWTGDMFSCSVHCDWYVNAITERQYISYTNTLFSFGLGGVKKHRCINNGWVEVLLSSHLAETLPD